MNSSAAPTPGKEKDKLGLWITIIVIAIAAIAFIYSSMQSSTPSGTVPPVNTPPVAPAAVQTPAQSAEAAQEITSINNDLQAITSSDTAADFAPIDQSLKGL